jgi:hypothetical protein
VLALAVGAYWTYTRFIKQHENFAIIEFTVDINFVDKQGGKWNVELIAFLKNKVKVQHQFADLSFDFALLLRDDSVRSSEKYSGQALFPHEMPRCLWLPPRKLFHRPWKQGKVFIHHTHS